MKLNKFTIKKADLDAMPEAERTLLVLLAHAANELNVLAKLFHACAQAPVALDVEVKARNAQALIVGRILTAKLYESWELIRKAFYASSISRSYDPEFDPIASDALGKLKAYFGSANLIEAVRNRHAFHYSPSDVQLAYLSFPANEELEMYIADHNGNTFFHFADVICNHALLTKIHATDIGAAFDRMIVETGQVLGWLNQFIGQCMTIALVRHLAEADGTINCDEIDVTGAPSHEGVSVPYFLDIPGLGK